MRRSRSILFVLVVLITIFAAGCAQKSVRHLKRNPWTVNKQENLQTQYWRFEYSVLPMRDTFGVKGIAYPVANAIPEWAKKVEDLWIEAYISNTKGQVIASDLRVFVSRPLDRKKGVDFEFVLKPERLVSGPLFISFGYRMTLSDGEGLPGAESREVFFGSESALIR